jgi:hypothetical protein
MDMLRASNVNSTPIDPKINVKRGSDINEYEEDILYGHEDDIPEKGEMITTKYGVVEQFTRNGIEFMPMPPYKIQRIPDMRDLEMRVQLFHKDAEVEHKLMKEYLIENDDLPEPVDIFQKINKLFIALKFNSECELLQYTWWSKTLPLMNS